MLSNALAKILQENRLNTGIFHSLTNKKAKLIIYLCSRENVVYMARTDLRRWGV